MKIRGVGLIPTPEPTPYAGVKRDDIYYIIAVIGLALWAAGWALHFIDGEKPE